MQASPAIHHHLEPLVDRRFVLLPGIHSEQCFCRVEGRRSRLVVIVHHLQASQAGLQMSSLEDVLGVRQPQGLLERFPGLSTSRGAPEHVGELGPQFHVRRRVAARVLLVHDGQCRAV